MGLGWEETRTRVYNFEVEGTHTYYTAGVWVHNARPCPIAYGPSADGGLRDFANAHDAINLNDLPGPPDGDWIRYSLSTLDQAKADGRDVLFDLTNMDDIPGVLAGTGEWADNVTGHELRHIRSNWNSGFSDNVTFYFFGHEASPPWLWNH